MCWNWLTCLTAHYQAIYLSAAQLSSRWCFLWAASSSPPSRHWNLVSIGEQLMLHRLLYVAASSSLSSPHRKPTSIKIWIATTMHLLISEGTTHYRCLTNTVRQCWRRQWQRGEGREQHPTNNANACLFHPSTHYNAGLVWPLARRLTEN